MSDISAELALVAPGQSAGPLVLVRYELDRPVQADDLPMKFDVTINATVHLHQYLHADTAELGCKLDKILAAANSTEEKVSQTMATLDEVKAKVEAQDLKLDAIRAAIAELRTQELSPAAQAKVDEIA